ncbi:hypothetical protein F3533_24125 [Vibrio parahaemolyticus]|nr:hypothetical protein [Vibrio parahaemolyticus]
MAINLTLHSLIKRTKTLSELVTNMFSQILMSCVMLISLMINDIIINKLIFYRARQYLQFKGLFPLFSKRERQNSQVVGLRYAKYHPR